MIDSDPILFAAKVMRLTDEELIAAWLNLALDSESSDWGQALRDEIMLRRLSIEPERAEVPPEPSIGKSNPGETRG
jgi:hypothetical protein